jgi:hypothetical protein
MLIGLGCGDDTPDPGVTPGTGDPDTAATTGEDPGTTTDTPDPTGTEDSTTGEDVADTDDTGTGGEDTTDTGATTADDTQDPPDTTIDDTGGTTGGPDVPDTCESNADCFDGNPCTIGVCFAEKCAYSSISGCEACTIDADEATLGEECASGNACQKPSCKAAGDEFFYGTCEYAQESCFDDNPCTIDQCNELTGCEYVWLPAQQCSLCGPK